MVAYRLGLVAVVLLLAVPPVQASVDLTAEITFDGRDRYTLALEVIHTGPHALDHRASADRDEDGTVSGEEASRQKAELQAQLEETDATGHRLDGHRPDRITVDRVWTEGLIGSVDQDEPVHLIVSARYTYTLNTTGPVVFQVLREPPPDHRNESLVLHAPDRHRITDPSNLSGPDGDPEVTNRTRDGTARLTAIPEGSWEVTLVPEASSLAAAQPTSEANETQGDASPANGTPSTGEPLRRIEPPSQAPASGLAGLLAAMAGAALGARRRR